MVALYDHIQQLRAELDANTCPLERALITRELEAAETDHACEQAAFIASFDEG